MARDFRQNRPPIRCLVPISSPLESPAVHPSRGDIWETGAESPPSCSRTSPTAVCSEGYRRIAAGNLAGSSGVRVGALVRSGSGSTRLPRYGTSAIMNSAKGIKPLLWVGSSRHDLREFPEAVKDTMGYALHLAQTGTKHPQAKPVKGFGGAGVLEIVEDHAGDTYRAVYTVRFAGAVYVLHAFQKKSKRGIKTPKKDLDLVRDRLRRAEIDYAKY